LTPFAHRILFVRHGETAYNAEGRLQGQRDIPLNGKGREQANAVGRALRKLSGPDLDRLEASEAFVASPLARARETMEIARAAMGLPPERFRRSPELAEMSFGDWEGLTWPEVEARDPVGISARRADIWNFAPTQLRDARAAARCLVVDAVERRVRCLARRRRARAHETARRPRPQDRLGGQCLAGSDDIV
jgi:broad specificity phosphatase PhoE